MDCGQRPVGPVIQVNNLMARYDERIVLQNVTFQINSGEIFFIIGGSGCGKSTLLRHIIGLFQPAEGEVLIHGENISTAEGPELKKILSRIGVTYQSGALFGSMTLRENVRLPLEEFTSLDSSVMDLIAVMKLRLVGLDEFAEYLPSEISGGMQKRAALARAMALDPSILFLDEPSAGLDPITSAELDELILNLSRNLGVTFIIVSHELDSIMAIADRVIMLDKEEKTIIAQGPPDELRGESGHLKARNFFNRTVSRSLKKT